MKNLFGKLEFLKLDKFIQKVSPFLILFLIFLEILPYLILGENIKVFTYDFLDGAYANSNLIIKYKNDILSKFNFIVPEFMNGQSFNSIWSVKSIHLIWIWTFGPFYGYVFSKFIMIVVAFGGTYLFLIHFLINNKKTLCLWMAYFYSVVPFWGYDLSHAGVPMFFYVFFMLRREMSINNSIILYLILVFLAFYSSLILSGFFILFTLFALELKRTVKNKAIDYKVLFGFVVISFSYIISHWSLVDEYVFHPVKTNRHLFEFSYYNLTTSLKLTEAAFKYGIFTAMDNHTLMFFLSIVVMIHMFIYSLVSKPLFKSILYVSASCCIYGFIQWKEISFFHQSWIKIVPMDLTRFVFLNGFLWICIFGISLSYLININFKGKLVASFFILIHLYFIIISNPRLTQYNYLYSIKNYYSENLFHQIKSEIKAPLNSFRVISLGIPPAVPLYNGFYCLDGYSSTYSLQHKLDFNIIFEKEAKDKPELLAYLKENRCYSFAAEIGKECEFSKANNTEIQYLQWDIDQLKKLNCQYVMAGVAINQRNNKHFKLVKLFQESNSYWKIYLYKVI